MAAGTRRRSDKEHIIRDNLTRHNYGHTNKNYKRLLYRDLCGGGNFITQAAPTNFHQFYTRKILTESESIEDFREVTAAERADIEKAEAEAESMEPPQSFIDTWNAEGSYCHKSHASRPITAKYDPENAPDMAHPFVCNGLWLTYSDALDVYNHRLTRGTIRTGALRESHIRTALCAIHSIYAEDFSLDSLFCRAPNLEIVRLSTNDPQGIWVNDMTCTFMSCRKLREIVPAIVDVVKANKYPAWMNTFNMCDSLVSVKIKGLTHSLVFRDSPLLSLDSISFMVSNAANTSAITITVHPDVYAKLTGDTTNAAAAALTADELATWQQVLADAMTKNISFTTT